MKTATPKQILSDWTEGEKTGDIERLQATLAEKFLAVGPKGFVLTKDDWLQRFESLAYGSLEVNVKCSQQIKNTSVIIPGVIQRGYFKGHAIDGSFIISQTWLEIDGSWQLISMQYTPTETNNN